MDDTTRKARYELFQFYLRECRPPTVDELAKASGLDSSEVPSILKKLEDAHHIVLYKHESCSPTPIAMAHPFSHLSVQYAVIDIQMWLTNIIAHAVRLLLSW